MVSIKNVLLLMTISVVSAVCTVFALQYCPMPFQQWVAGGNMPLISPATPTSPIHSVAFTTNEFNGGVYRSPVVIPTDLTPSSPTPYNKSFVSAAYKTLPAVVHIKVGTGIASGNRDVAIGGETYDNRGNSSSGSGVLISGSGHIITNHHVVEGAKNINVVLYDNSSYKATVVGTDPATDIALLKIVSAPAGRNFPMLELADSDSLMVGEWVLAVGNPYNLSSTVTAGIVSAKARNINMLQEQFAVESFIQTDAAVNPGNSGGPLVNTQGRLVGINTAIASVSGSSEGYSFAVPSNLVKKVVDDLQKYSLVQRAYLGASTQDITSQIADQNKLNSMAGVFIESVSPNSAAAEAGLRKGDVIVEVNGLAVNNVSELLEKMARFRPGDRAGITIMRNGKSIFPQVTFKNSLQSTTLAVNPQENLVTLLGAHFQELSVNELQRMGIKNGIRIVKLIDNGVLKNKTGIKEDYIITRANNTNIKSIKDLNQLIKNTPKGDNITFDCMLVGEKGSKTFVLPW